MLLYYENIVCLQKKKNILCCKIFNKILAVYFVTNFIKKSMHGQKRSTRRIAEEHLPYTVLRFTLVGSATRCVPGCTRMMMAWEKNGPLISQNFFVALDGKLLISGIIKAELRVITITVEPRYNDMPSRAVKLYRYIVSI